MEQLPANLETIGIAGIAIALVWVVWKLTSNHISHNSEVLGELKEAIHKLADILDKKL